MASTRKLKLTKALIAELRAKPPAHRLEIRDREFPALLLRVQPSGAASFAIRRRQELPIDPEPRAVARLGPPAGDRDNHGRRRRARPGAQEDAGGSTFGAYLDQPDLQVGGRTRAPVYRDEPGAGVERHRPQSR